MKANAPDKVYISTNSQDGTYYISNQYKRLIEYTRTDAFIEKALAFIRSCTTYDGLGYKAKCVNIEEFKKYMKGG